MKKVLVFLLIIMSLLLSACTNKYQVVENDIFATTEPIYTEAPVAKFDTVFNEVLVKIDNYSSQLLDPVDGSELIFYFYVETPSIHISDNEIASNFINEYLLNLNNTYYAITDEHDTSLDLESLLQAESLDNYSYYLSTDADVNKFFSFERNVDVYKINNSYIVFKFINTTITNDIVSDSQVVAFDLNDGSLVDIDYETFDDLNFKESECKLSINHLIDNKNIKEIIDLVTIDEDGDDYLISIDGEAYNLKIYVSELYENVDKVNLLWFCNYISNSSIQIKSNLSIFPNVLIEYCDYDGNAFTYYVQNNSENKTLEMVDSNSVVIVG